MGNLQVYISHVRNCKVFLKTTKDDALFPPIQKKVFKRIVTFYLVYFYININISQLIL